MSKRFTPYLTALVAACWIVLSAGAAQAIPSPCIPSFYDYYPSNYWDTQVTFQSSPSGAAVYIDGNSGYLGRKVCDSTPCNVFIPNWRKDTHIVHFVKPGYSVMRRYAVNTASQSLVINAALFAALEESYTTGVQLLNDQASTLSVGARSAPFIVDINKDGRKDLISGNDAGDIYLYRNNRVTDSGADFAVQERLGQADCFKNPLNCVDSIPGGYANPFVVDWNNDGLQDLLVGAGDGKVWLYYGIDTSPAAKDKRLQEFCSIGVELVNVASDCAICGGNASPWVVDWDGDGYKDLLVGSAQGYIALYTNSYAFDDHSANCELCGSCASQPDCDLCDIDPDPLSNCLGTCDIGTCAWRLHQPPILNYSGLLTFADTSAQIKPAKFSNPQMIDLDYDGRLDLVVSTLTEVNVYSNLGDAGDPLPHFYSATRRILQAVPQSTALPFNAFTPQTTGAQYYSHAFITDFSTDPAQDLQSGYFLRDLILGTADGTFRFFASKILEGNLVEEASLTVNGLDLIRLNLCLGQPAGTTVQYGSTTIECPEQTEVGPRDSQIDESDRDVLGVHFGSLYDQCGDGVVQNTGNCTPGAPNCEECDDNNNNNLDGCNYRCRTEACVVDYQADFLAADGGFAQTAEAGLEWSWQSGVGWSVVHTYTAPASGLTRSELIGPSVTLYNNSYIRWTEVFNGSEEAHTCDLEVQTGSRLPGRTRVCQNSNPLTPVQKHMGLTTYGNGVSAQLVFTVGFDSDAVPTSGASANWTITNVEVGRCTDPGY